MKKALRIPLPSFSRKKKNVLDERLCASAEEPGTCDESPVGNIKRYNSQPLFSPRVGMASKVDPSSPSSTREPSSPSSTREPSSPSSTCEPSSPRMQGCWPAQGTKVLLHVYDMDQTFGVINRQLLEHRGLGVFHVGVEVYNQEYWFSGQEHDNMTTGVRVCVPKTVHKANYRETIELGWTSHTEAETEALVRGLCDEWLAKEYHLTRRNCLSFSQVLCERLGLKDEFPAHLKNACDLIHDSSALTAVVDGTLSARRWWNAGGIFSA